MELNRTYISTVYLFAVRVAVSTRIFIIICSSPRPRHSLRLPVRTTRRRPYNDLLCSVAAQFLTPIERGSTTIGVSTCTTLMKAFSSDRLSRPRAKNMHV